MNSGIYCIRNTVNNKRYIGSAKNLDVRKKQHFYNLENEKHINIVLQRAYGKYGGSSFLFEVIEICEIENLLEKEEYYIEHYCSMANDGGYNIGSVGGGDNLTNHPDREDIISRIAYSIKKRNDGLSQDEKNERWARHGECNPNWRGGISSCKSCGKRLSKRPIHGMCSECGGRKDTSGKNNHFYGKTHCDELKGTLSVKRAKYYATMSDEDYKNLQQTVSVSVEGEVIHGLSRAGRMHNVSPATVRYRCLSKTKRWENWFYVNV